MAKQRLATLEYLRAVCALVVMLNHTWCEGVGLPQYLPIVAIASYSIEAVMGFFVLSGCVISLQDYPDTGAYVRARLLRILPIYYVALALALAGMLICHMSFRTTQLVGDVFFLQTQDWQLFDPLRFFIPSWSLSYELYYYAGFIVLMAMPRLLLPALAASVVMGIGLYLVDKPAPPALWLAHVFAFFGMWLAGVVITRVTRNGRAVSLGTGAFMLAVGLCLARVPLSTPSKFDYFRLACFSTGFAFFVWAMLSDAMLPPVKRKSTLELGPAARAVIAAGGLLLFWRESDSHLATKVVLAASVLAFAVAPATMARLIGRAVRPTMPFMSYVAGLSYALYLVHYPVVQTFNSLGILPPFASFAVVVLLSFGLAHVLEYRFQPWVRARLASHKPSAATASRSSIRT
jgi:peptidoglycan/LPS O-acetylase OafA/YrhL